MSFPWKKARSTKISKFVNDHLHNSQKRRDGSSFVVETGFPTSLIDLFIKNRENLKKPSKKKRSKPLNITPIDVVNSYNYSNQVISGSPTPYPSPVPSPSSVIESSPLPSVDEIVVLEERGVEKGVVLNGFFLTVFKMFLMVVLALGTKRLTIGITLSAFFLFFLESMGKRAFGFFKSCLEIKGVLRLVFNRNLLRFKECKLDHKNGCIEKDGSLNSESRYAIEENRVEEIISEENEIMDAFGYEGRLEYQEIESEVVMEKEESLCSRLVGSKMWKESRRAKIKSKMNKFVQKKLRSSIKEAHHYPTRVQIVNEEQELVQCEGERDSENSSNLSSISSESYREEDAMNTICSFDISSEVNEKDKVKESGLIWKSLVLFFIVLVGLIRGRAFALLLTLLWYSLLKLSEALPRYR